MSQLPDQPATESPAYMPMQIGTPEEFQVGLQAFKESIVEAGEAKREQLQNEEEKEPVQPVYNRATRRRIAQAYNPKFGRRGKRQFEKAVTIRKQQQHRLLFQLAAHAQEEEDGPNLEALAAIKKQMPNPPARGFGG